LGEALRQQERYDGAIVAYRQALSLINYLDLIEMRSVHALTHNALGLVLQAQGHAAEAAQSFRTAIDLDPRFLEAQQNLESLQALN
jgi:tetratricopeptide (TPR) repeat protein